VRGTVDTTAEPVLVGQHQLGEGAPQRGGLGQHGRLIHRRESVDDNGLLVPTLFRPATFPAR
jgi:hypothetical protein